jgi:acetaldehyde dehydrogenase/alcohol dehydrogenase
MKGEVMKTNKVRNTDNPDVKGTIDALVEKASQALAQFMTMEQEQVDRIVKAMAMAGLDQHMRLAKMAIEETKRGVYEDKIVKNLFATEYIYHSIKYEKTVGIIDENELEGYVEVAEPVGVIAGVTPVTNPTSTTMFKALISVKTRNPIIFAFHPSAQKSSSEAARVMLEAAVAEGAPKDCIQWIETPSLEATQTLMGHPGVNLILATGGSGMVKSAYSTGKPALGVGPGNVPCYIEKTAEIKRAVTDLILSKSFDNGMICASEQAVILDREIADEAIEFMKENTCYFLYDEELRKVEDVVINKEKGAVNPVIVGQSAYDIARMAGVEVPKDTKLLVAPIDGVGPNYPLSREKLSPVLALYIVDGYEEGIKRAEEMVAFGGGVLKAASWVFPQRPLQP